MSTRRYQKLLVTGAAGTVGNYVASLAEAAGYHVVASDRKATGLRTPVRGEVSVGDLCDSRFVERVVHGCEAIIHTAAQLDTDAHTAELSKTNTEVVAMLYEAARSAGVKRFVHTSTALIYDTNYSGSLTESASIAPRGTHGLSKHGAEIYLRGMTDPKGPAWTIVRPAPVYGRRGRHYAASLLAVGPIMALFAPRLPHLRGGPLTNLVHAEDVASALLFVLEREVAHGQIFNVAEPDPMPLGNRLTASFEAYGYKTLPGVMLPRAILSLFSRGLSTPGSYRAFHTSAEALWKVVCRRHHLKQALTPRIDRESLALLHNDFVIDSSRLRSLGWSARYPRFARGWIEVLKWYQAERWVPRHR